MSSAKLIQEELVALVTEQTNRTLFILTVVTVAAVPINLVALSSAHALCRRGSPTHRSAKRRGC
jgi:hypothetical protein